MVLRGMTIRLSWRSMLTPAGSRSLYAKVSSVPMTAMSPLSSSQSSGQLASPVVEPSSWADLPRRLLKLAPGSASHLPLTVKPAPSALHRPPGSHWETAYSDIGNYAISGHRRLWTIVILYHQ